MVKLWPLKVCKISSAHIRGQLMSFLFIVWQNGLKSPNF